jgi:hypothetical protein
VGEIGSGMITAKGVPIEVARDSAEYQKVLAKLDALNLGGGKGAADRALVSDAFFAKTEAGAKSKLAQVGRQRELAVAASRDHGGGGLVEHDALAADDGAGPPRRPR